MSPTDTNAPGLGESPGPLGPTDPTGAWRDHVTIDPFAKAVAFMTDVFDGHIVSFADRSPIQPIEPLDTKVDRRMDLDAIIDAQSSWEGAVKAPRTMRDDELSHEVTDQMREKERQFILRNIGRKEMFNDPDEPLPFEATEVDVAIIEGVLDEIRSLTYEPPPLIDDMTLDTVRDNLKWRKRFTRELQWERHFGHEVAANVEGPLWRYDPDAVVEEEASDVDDAAAAAERPRTDGRPSQREEQAP